MNDPAGAPAHPYLDAVTRLLVDALGPRLAPGVGDYLDLFAEDGVLETPYGPPRDTSRVAGREDLASFVESLRGYVVLSDMRLQTCHLGDDGYTFLEYGGTVHQPQRGITFAQQYVAVVRTERGRVTVFREYTDPSRAEAPERWPAAGSHE